MFIVFLNKTRKILCFLEEKMTSQSFKFINDHSFALRNYCFQHFLIKFIKFLFMIRLIYQWRTFWQKNKFGYVWPKCFLKKIHKNVDVKSSTLNLFEFLLFFRDTLFVILFRYILELIQKRFENIVDVSSYNSWIFFIKLLFKLQKNIHWEFEEKRIKTKEKIWIIGRFEVWFGKWHVLTDLFLLSHNITYSQKIIQDQKN